MQERKQEKYGCPNAVGQEKLYAVTPLNKIGDANARMTEIIPTMNSKMSIDSHLP